MRNSIRSVSFFLLLVLSGCSGTGVKSEIDEDQLDKLHQHVWLHWIMYHEVSTAESIERVLRERATSKELDLLGRLEGLNIQEVHLVNQPELNSAGFYEPVLLRVAKIIEKRFFESTSCDQEYKTKLTIAFYEASLGAAGTAGLLGVAPLCIGTLGSVCPSKSSEYVVLAADIVGKNGTQTLSGIGGSWQYTGSVLLGDSKEMTEKLAKDAFAHAIAGALVSMANEVEHKNVNLCRQASNNI